MFFVFIAAMDRLPAPQAHTPPPQAHMPPPQLRMPPPPLTPSRLLLARTR